MTSFLIIPSEASISFFLFKVTYRYHFYQVTYPVLRDRCWFGYRLQVGALFTTVPSIRVSRVGRVRVTLTVTVRVSRVSIMVSVRDSVKLGHTCKRRSEILVPC